MKTVTIKTVWKYFNRYNKKYFSNKIPNKNVYIGVSDKYMKTSLAATVEETYERKDGSQYKVYTITFSKRAYSCGLRIICFLLLHEMTHIKVGLEHSHDKVYQMAQKKLMYIGAYDDLI